MRLDELVGFQEGGIQNNFFLGGGGGKVGAGEDL